MDKKKYESDDRLS